MSDLKVWKRFVSWTIASEVTQYFIPSRLLDAPRVLSARCWLLGF